MNSFVDNVALALSTIRSTPLRSTLTLLGITIGACTVVAMMSFTEGLRLRVNGDLATLGASAFVVQKWPIGLTDLERRKVGLRGDLTREQGEALKSLPHVRHVSIEASRKSMERLWTKDRATNPNIRIVGGTPGYEHANALVVEKGRFFTDVDLALARRVAVIGADVAELLFPGMNPVGEEIRLRHTAFTVIGVTERKGSVIGQSRDTFAVVPLDAYYAVTGNLSNHTIGIVAANSDEIPMAMDEVVQTLRRVRGLRPDEANDFDIATNESAAASVNKVAAAVSASTFIVSALSLIIGGIGIMNIMLVSVAERTREIGVRMALGARRKRILGQFVVEATVLSMIGAVIGSLLGAGIATGANRWWDVPASISLPAVALSLLTALGCGLLFGIYPASRASKLDPVEAMRAQ